VAVDVATVSPPQDVNNMAAHLRTHVIYELLCDPVSPAFPGFVAWR
jgi:hypothetical protein